VPAPLLSAILTRALIVFLEQTRKSSAATSPAGISADRGHGAVLANRSASGDFVKRTSVIEYTQAGLGAPGHAHRVEGLPATAGQRKFD
jgi:hypothetical protein